MKNNILFALSYGQFKAEYYSNGEGYIMDYTYEIPIRFKNLSTIRFLNDSIRHGIKQGYEEFEVQINDGGDYPNICAPVAGLLQYYKNNTNLKFDIKSSPNSYIRHTHLENPIAVNDAIGTFEITSPFDKVWVFSDETEISMLVNNYLLYIRQADVIAEGVIGSIDWCLNEVMDNVLLHSDTNCGYIMGQIHPANKRLNFCIFDYGRGMYNSLKNSVHRPQSPIDAITMALQEKVTRDTKVGQGNGLWGLSKIITQSNGILRISSNGALYENINGAVTTKNNSSFYLSRTIGTTTIDFQLDYSKDMNITTALTGYNYQYADLWLENLESESDDNIVNIKISETARGTGTRKSAEKLRNLVINIVNNDRKRIILDFEGINTMSSSFADELIGKIIMDKGFMFFIQVFKLIHLNPMIIGIINRSVEQRMAQTYYDHSIAIED